MHLEIEEHQISSEYLARHDCQIDIKHKQNILVLNNLFGKTYVTPHIVTTFFQERGCPYCNFFVPRPAPARGLPVWFGGLMFLPPPESWVRWHAT
jgi:hypothetical protein